MKNLKSITLALALTLGIATVSAQTTKKVDAAGSQIVWTGKKVTGEHKGTINLKEGSLVFKGQKLVGGNFTVDMTTISTTDLTGEWKDKLDGHLKNEDFFSTAKFPSSKLEFKLIADNGNGNYTVVGDLTIKEIKNSIKFTILVKDNTATTSLKIDRTKFDIKYGSGNFFENLGDKTIADEFELVVNLKF
jgi:polyisoprenoid-binding protein YceI